MFEYYKYKNNLDLVDKFGVQDIDVDKSFIYQGSVDLINKEIPKVKNHRSPPLGAAFVGLNNTAAPLSNKTENHCWTDIDAQETFLLSKPTCYLILGKPGSGCYSLGESLSKKLKCVHLCPKTIIGDEIDQKSTTGNALDFNFRHNKICRFDIILTLLKKKLASSAVKHRGYVISGFPMVTSNRDQRYFIGSLHSEESLDVVEEFLYDLICNLKKKKRKQKNPPATSQSSDSSDVEAKGEYEPEEEQVLEQEEVVEEEQEPPVELPKFILDSCSNIIFYQKSYFEAKPVALLKQFQEVINITPDIVIYITCPDVDLMTKKSHKYFNYISNQHSFNPFLKMKEDLEIRWPTKYTISDYISPFDSHIFNPKYNCRQPFNFKNQSVEQMCNYKKYILSYIEKKIKDFDAKMFIKLDGRTSTHTMMHHVMERLVFLDIKPVLIPEPLYLEEPPEDMEEFWKLVDGLNVIQSGVVNFNRYMSPWFNRCPVELKNRQSVQGKPKFAVMFFRHVYLLSSLSAMISFCRNPRPYLKLKYLEPTCRIIVIGTQLAGKTMVSECLSWIFDAPVFCYQKILEEERIKKYDIYAKSILSEIIATIEDARLVAWQNAELERYRNLELWYDSTEGNLNEFVPLLEENIKYTQRQKLYLEEERISELQVESEDKSLKTGKGFREEKDLGEDFWESFNLLSNKLSFLPFLDDIEKCNIALLDRNFLSQFAPIDLLTVTEKPGIPVLSDEDVTNAISAYIITNELQKEIEPTVEELVNEITRIISVIDMEVKKSTNAEHYYGKYIIDGFPSDLEFWSHLIDSKCLPDYTIGLFENKAIDTDLVNHYLTIEKSIKNHAGRFGLVDDPLIKTKLRTTNIPDSNKIDIQILLDETINNTLNILWVQTAEGERSKLEASLMTSLTESVEKFQEDWESIKFKLEENAKAFVDIQLERKTDLQIMEEALLKIRSNYSISCETIEQEDTEVPEDEDEMLTDSLTYNNSKFLCENSTYCPVAYCDYKVLWEGKPEFCVKYNNKIHYFCNEKCYLVFQNDPTKYQFYNNPFKKIPSLKICVIGSIGSGKSTLSTYLAKELGLLHINFEDAINDFLMPRNFKKVGRRYENIFTDIPIDDEAVSEFHIDEENEDKVFDILSNENELRRMVYNYFERGSAIIPALMYRLLKKIWFQNPFETNGFVLDGYPRLPTDIDDMVTCFCIPDIIITLESTSEKSLERISTKMFRTWKNQLNEAKNVAKLKLDSEKKEWMNVVTKNVVVKLIFDEMIDKIFISTENLVKGLSAASVIIDAHPSGSSNVDANLFNTYNEMIQNLPEPTDQSVWEKATDARERIDARIESIYEVDDENIQSMKDTLIEQRIKYVSIDATNNIDKVLRVALLKLKSLRNRNSSFFEQTFIVDTDIADILLTTGFHFLSKFKRMCPVHIFENPKNIIHPYKINKKKSNIFPIVHRCYIYFICGAENVRKFRADPLKYINSEAIKLFYDYPLRISVIGGPKSGKSSLAEKLSKQYGLICISRGKSIRQIMENMAWTELGSKMIKAVQQGDKIDFELIVKAIQTVLIDYRTTTSGYLFDGFPDSPCEALELSKHGLFPSIIFDISSTKDKMLQNSQNETYLNIIKLKPPYSAAFIEFRYQMFKDRIYAIRDWIQNDYQNLNSIDGTKSKWHCFRDADDIISSIIPKIHYYLSNEKNSAVPVDVMCISNAMFEKKMSNFKNMCPLCLRKNVLKCSGYPVNKKGVVRFKNKFYWICADHMDSVLNHPYYYLAQQNVDIPEIPAVIKTIHCDRVYENGVCIVTYAENLPAQKIEIGSRQFAASFKGSNYLFCSEKCLLKFLAKPHMYSDITVFKETKLFPPLPLKNLPNLGYLEQTVGIMLTEACCALNVARPKYPGLSIQLSGLLYLALYLKTHNPLMDKPALGLYEQVFKTYEARCNLIINVGLRLRSMDNPFANYPKCCERGKKKIAIRNVSTASSAKQTRSPSSTDALTAVSD